MLDAKDIAAVPLFSALNATELDRLARKSADMRLSAGEFAVHEGGERALYAVLAGKIEVVKMIDGIERRLGWRVPGAIFGEVPITLGTPFPGGYRASEPSRVMRIDVQDYYALAAVSNEISLKVTTLARERLGGLQNIATENHAPRITLIGHQWDTDCTNVRHFLSRNQIAFNWVTPDSPEYAAMFPGTRAPENGHLALRLADGEMIARPQVRDIANRLGLQTRPHTTKYDVVVIGAGPAAGLAAAVYGASEGLETLVVEREAPGGQAGTSSSRIENYLGFPNGVSGEELASRAFAQAKRLGADFLVARSIMKIDDDRARGRSRRRRCRARAHRSSSRPG